MADAVRRLRGWSFVHSPVETQDILSPWIGTRYSRGSLTDLRNKVGPFIIPEK
jgi:hypothetical protein